MTDETNLEYIPIFLSYEAEVQWKKKWLERKIYKLQNTLARLEQTEQNSLQINTDILEFDCCSRTKYPPLDRMDCVILGPVYKPFANPERLLENSFAPILPIWEEENHEPHEKYSSDGIGDESEAESNEFDSEDDESANLSSNQNNLNSKVSSENESTFVSDITNNTPEDISSEIFEIKSPQNSQFEENEENENQSNKVDTFSSNFSHSQPTNSNVKQQFTLNHPSNNSSSHSQQTPLHFPKISFQPQTQPFEKKEIITPKFTKCQKFAHFEGNESTKKDLEKIRRKMERDHNNIEVISNRIKNGLLDTPIEKIISSISHYELQNDLTLEESKLEQKYISRKIKPQIPPNWEIRSYDQPEDTLNKEEREIMACKMEMALSQDKLETSCLFNHLDYRPVRIRTSIITIPDFEIFTDCSSENTDEYDFDLPND